MQHPTHLFGVGNQHRRLFFGHDLNPSPQFDLRLKLVVRAVRESQMVSLGTFVLAAMLSDVLWTIFMLAGLEEVRFAPGIGAAQYFVAVDIGLSHSLVMCLVWALCSRASRPSPHGREVAPSGSSWRSSAIGCSTSSAIGLTCRSSREEPTSSG